MAAASAVTITVEKERGIGGRKPVEIKYSSVIYNGFAYIIGQINKLDGTTVKFVFDSEDETKVKSRSWHSSVRDSYISSAFVTSDGDRKSLYLHNFILGKDFEGKGSLLTVDHINGIGFDNRKSNLRIIDQSLQNYNTRNRARKTTKLPKEIDPASIPRNIWYIPPNGGHGDRFAVEIKGIPDVGDIVWRSSSSKTMTAQEKLEQAIQKRREYFDTYPILKEFSRESKEALRLKKEFEEIIALV